VSPNFTLDSVADSNYRGKCAVDGFFIFQWTLRVSLIRGSTCRERFFDCFRWFGDAGRKSSVTSLLALLLSFEVVAVAAATTVVELPATSFSRVVVPTVGVVAASTDFGGQLTQVFFCMENCCIKLVLRQTVTN
jgi:hypothetical protein